jgi:hypothetical protein
MQKDKAALKLAILGAAIGMLGNNPGPQPTIHNGVRRVTETWDRVQLTKAERKGKTPEEIQQLRKEKYNARHG